MWSGAPASAFAKKAQIVAPGGAQDEPIAPTKAESLDIASLRRSCTNTLHLACALLGDLEVKTTLRAICGLIRPLRHEFAWQNSKMVTCSAAAEVYTSYSCGKGRESLGSMVELLQGGALFAEVAVQDAGRLPPHGVVARPRRRCEPPLDHERWLGCESVDEVPPPVAQGKVEEFELVWEGLPWCLREGFGGEIGIRVALGWHEV